MSAPPPNPRIPPTYASSTHRWSYATTEMFHVRHEYAADATDEENIIDPNPLWEQEKPPLSGPGRLQFQRPRSTIAPRTSSKAQRHTCTPKVQNISPWSRERRLGKYSKDRVSQPTVAAPELSKSMPPLPCRLQTPTVQPRLWVPRANARLLSRRPEPCRLKCTTPPCPLRRIPPTLPHPQQHLRRPTKRHPQSTPLIHSRRKCTRCHTTPLCTTQVQHHRISIRFLQSTDLSAQTRHIDSQRVSLSRMGNGLLRRYFRRLIQFMGFSGRALWRTECLVMAGDVLW
ncbi:hypothetical protein K458DRAFT_15964 [Lentithecium fluviatile CBS 122367]|uniref:Uncharacterized protein n=1 Tax=Lentithecium fluviatile CBS 122367 TaxID=1168545 RepID=A0A6G1J611_9PLEO|nr:hypothetical protein K458DRAFT_15964 [Lentithecium fluviatile CBS 122367]